MVDVVLDWDVERQRYDELLARAGRSSLLQDWAWGEAKAQAGEGAPRRAVVSVGGSDVAVVQLLVRRMGPVVVARLNRGPVWLDDGAGTEVKGAVLRCLAASWRWWRGSVLMAAPEIPDGPQGSAIVAAAGMRRRRVPLGSIWNRHRTPCGRG